MRLTVLRIGDNYAYGLSEGSDAWVIDPTAAGPVEEWLVRHGLTLRLILNTHHHDDHTAGNQSLRRRFEAPVAAAAPGADRPLADGATLRLGPHALQILATPGHTQDSVCFFLPGRPARLFTGDTLFLMGCGRLFEGTAEQLWGSLRRLAELPRETLIYPGHAYTRDNAEFAHTVDPGNLAVARRRNAIARLEASGRPCVPATLALEQQTNPFLRASSPETFAALRRRKDRY